MKPILTFFLFLFFIHHATGAGVFKFSDQARLAYDQAISLQFDAARKNVAILKQQEPDNLLVHLIENYIDFFTIFIDENEIDFKRLEKNKNYRLEQIRKGDSYSPYYLYCQAEIKLQWALARLKFEEYFTAFNEVKSAYQLLNENEEQFPFFIANKKSLGILHAMVGTVPENYQWGIKLLGGMEGSIEQGREEIESVVRFSQQNDFVFEEETLVMYAFLLLHLNNQSDRAWATISSKKLNAKSNPLAAFVLANVAMHTGRNDEAIQLLESAPRGGRFHPFPFLDYMLGLAKLHRLDQDADRYLLKYLNNFTGRNYIKEAYQKIAWFHLINGDTQGYKNNLALCRENGYTVIDEDKTAQKEAKEDVVPNTVLLKARLLFDGGYYERAYTMLKGYSKASFTEQRYQLEYTYRLGRICQGLHRYPESLSYYQSTIDQGKESGYYYACNAALQAGVIHENQHQYPQASKYYEICLEMKPDEYKSSLHQKAKAGLNRLKGK